MSSGIYDVCKSDMMKAQSNFGAAGNDFYVALMDNNFSFNASDTTFSNTHEITGVNYDSGGKLITGQSINGTTTTRWSADNPSWIAATFDAYYAVIYDSSNANHLIACIDFNGEQSIGAGTFTLVWAANGILSLT